MFKLLFCTSDIQNRVSEREMLFYKMNWIYKLYNNYLILSLDLCNLK